MTDILKELFESPLYDRGCEPTEELTTLRKKESELWGRVKSVLSMDLIDEIGNTQAAISDEKSFQWYREGFRLGALLMLELIKN